jgi:hypothetical protein
LGFGGRSRTNISILDPNCETTAAPKAMMIKHPFWTHAVRNEGLGHDDTGTPTILHKPAPGTIESNRGPIDPSDTAKIIALDQFRFVTPCALRGAAGASPPQVRREPIPGFGGDRDPPIISAYRRQATVSGNPDPRAGASPTQ